MLESMLQRRQMYVHYLGFCNMFVYFITVVCVYD